MRDFEFDADKQASQRDSAHKLKQDAEEKRSTLEQWSSSAYGEVSCLQVSFICMPLLPGLVSTAALSGYTVRVSAGWRVRDL